MNKRHDKNTYTEKFQELVGLGKMNIQQIFNDSVETSMLKIWNLGSVSYAD